ncbi:MAG: ABC transporter permease [Pseudonocardiales bacterium]|nr:ABC transporter permease [Pseudonocardiales bacterium]
MPSSRGLGFDGQKQRLAKGDPILDRQVTVYDPDLDAEDLFGSRFAADDDPFSDAAVLRDSWFDWLVRGMCYLNTAAPSFWIGLLLLWLFAVHLGWLPSGGTADYRSVDAPALNPRHLVLPALTLAATQYAWFTLYVRTNVLEVQREDYVRFAEAGGLCRARVLFRHALPNALLTFITLIGTHLSELIGGAVLAEVIFG